MTSIITRIDLARELAKAQAKLEALEIIAPGHTRAVISLRRRTWPPYEPYERLEALRTSLTPRLPLGLVCDFVLYSGDGPYRSPGGGG